jgi:hypothetical protein
MARKQGKSSLPDRRTEADPLAQILRQAASQAMSSALAQLLVALVRSGSSPRSDRRRGEGAKA